MGRQIGKYDHDLIPSINDSVIGTENSTGITKNYRFKETFSLLDEIVEKTELIFEYANAANLQTELNSGIMTADSDDLSALTQIKINRYSYNEDDVTDIMVALKNTLITESIFIDLKNSSDGSNFATFSITGITNNSTHFIVGLAVNGGYYSGTLDNGSYYFLAPKFGSVTGSLSPSEVKGLYESNSNTNAFTDNEKTKLSEVKYGTSSVATLKLLTTLSIGNLVETDSYYGDGNGGRNVYIKVTDTGQVDNGGSIIKGNDGSVYEMYNKDILTFEQYGIIGTSGVDQAPIIQAALDNGNIKEVVSENIYTNYYIKTPIYFTSLHENMIIDFGNTWIKSDTGFTSNDMVRLWNGYDSSITHPSLVAAKHFENLHIKTINIDGSADVQGMLDDLTSDNTVTTDNYTTKVEAARISFIADLGYSINGLNIDGDKNNPQNVEMSNIRFDNINVKDIGKSALIDSLACSGISYGQLKVQRSGVHSFVSQSFIDPEIRSTYWIPIINIDGIVAHSASTAFDISSNTAAYGIESFGTVNIGKIVASNIFTRTKIYSSWDVNIGEAIFDRPFPKSIWSCIDIVDDGLLYVRRLNINTLKCTNLRTWGLTSPACMAIEGGLIGYDTIKIDTLIVEEAEVAMGCNAKTIINHVKLLGVDHAICLTGNYWIKTLTADRNSKTQTNPVPRLASYLFNNITNFHCDYMRLIDYNNAISGLFVNHTGETHTHIKHAVFDQLNTSVVQPVGFTINTNTSSYQSTFKIDRITGNSEFTRILALGSGVDLAKTLVEVGSVELAALYAIDSTIGWRMTIEKIRNTYYWDYSGFKYNNTVFPTSGDDGTLLSNGASFSQTGTAIDLSNTNGTPYNMSAVSSATTYTTTNPVVMGFATCLINTTSEPTVTGATKISSATWVTGTDMHMVVQTLDGTNVQYYFIEI